MLSVLILCRGAECAWYVMRSTGAGAASNLHSLPFPAMNRADWMSLPRIARSASHPVLKGFL